MSLRRAARQFAFMCMAIALTGCATSMIGGRAVDMSIQSPNQDSRVRYLIIHFTQLDFGNSVRVLTDGKSERRVSSHYLVGINPPTIHRLVDEGRRAWHAGKSRWQNDTALNATSIGIEIVNMGDEGASGVQFADYPAAQIDAVLALVKDIATRHAIAPHRILGHSDIAPQRKTDPGPKFPWRRLAEAGLIPWPDPVQVESSRSRLGQTVPDATWFQERLAAVGYETPRTGMFDEATRRVIASFQMRYRTTRYDGLADADTAATLEVAARTDGWLIRKADGRWVSYDFDHD
jgi:N-acetylmuramoyl-L-alanine amidase